MQVIAGVVPPISRRYSTELRELIGRLLEVRGGGAGRRGGGVHFWCSVMLW